jgi:hypothetical protein
MEPFLAAHQIIFALFAITCAAQLFAQRSRRERLARNMPEFQRAPVNRSTAAQAE